MIDREFIDAIADLCQKGSKLEVVQLNHETAYVSQGGLREMVSIPPSPRDNTVYDLGSLIAAANHYSDRTTNETAVFVNQDRIKVVLDDSAHRVNVVTMPLKFHDQLEVVSGLDRRQLAPKEAVRLFRVDLAYSVAPAIVSMFRQVDFDRAEKQSKGTQHGRDTLGKSVEVAVQNVDKFPEDIVLMVPIYSSPGIDERRPIECALEILPEVGKFAIIPKCGQVQSAMNDATKAIIATLEEQLPEDVPVFYGEA